MLVLLMAFYSTSGSCKPCEIAPEMVKILKNCNAFHFEHCCTKTPYHNLGPLSPL